MQISPTGGLLYNHAIQVINNALKYESLFSERVLLVFWQVVYEHNRQLCVFSTEFRDKLETDCIPYRFGKVRRG